MTAGGQPGEGECRGTRAGALPSEDGAGCCTGDLGSYLSSSPRGKEWVEPTVAISHSKDFLASGLSYRKKKKGGVSCSIGHCSP